jgi:leucyl aminopeptidase
MFKGQPFPAGYEYVLETSQKYIPSVSQIEEDPFQIYSSIYGWYTAKNLVITYPGFGPNANEVVVFSAHLDSTSTQSQPWHRCRGYASGSASMLEAVRLLRYYKFDRTIKVIWFTGEEQWWWSEAYVSDHSTLDYVADVNLDMFGYDSNQDRCFELHVGTMDASDVIGVCFQDVIQD